MSYRPQKNLHFLGAFELPNSVDEWGFNFRRRFHQPQNLQRPSYSVLAYTQPYIKGFYQPNPPLYLLMAKIPIIHPQIPEVSYESFLFLRDGQETPSQELCPPPIHLSKTKFYSFGWL